MTTAKQAQACDTAPCRRPCLLPYLYIDSFIHLLTFVLSCSPNYFLLYIFISTFLLLCCSTFTVYICKTNYLLARLHLLFLYRWL